MGTTSQSMFYQMRLENTRLLVKGIEGLHLGYERRQREKGLDSDVSWQLGDLKGFVTEEYCQSIEGGDYLAQNPYADLFRFRSPTPNPKKMESEDSLRLSGMILLYHQLQILEDLPSDQLAEAYETLCNSIRSILEADMCYLVSHHLTDTRMLCASSVMEDDLNTQLDSKEAGELMDQLKEDGEFLTPAEDVFVKKSGAESGDSASPDKADAIILPIMLYDKKGTPREEQAYLICQRRGKPLWCENINQTILRIRDTLFLRGQLAQALTRDLTGLLTVAKEFRDIRRRSPESGPLKILHISDLHVTKINFKQLISDIQKLKLKDTPFDFLVITGDVVQGRYAAGDLEENYSYAAQVIRVLAMRMWGEDQNEKRVLRQDWKRRTIVIPGNHDYASMNELETQHGENHRASESGRPAAQEGSAMAKFTYYINFVRKLLDIEIGELVDNNLNELRCYNKMGVAFLCLNTSVMANPARNNKVHLDEGFVRRAIRHLSTEEEKQTVVFLGHHGPDYEIDYITDEYLEPFICQEIAKDFTRVLNDGSPEDQKGALKKLKDRLESLAKPSSGDELDNDFVQIWLLKNGLKELPSDISDIERKVIERRKATRLYSQLTFLLDQLEKSKSERSINERYQKIIAEVTRAKLLSEADQSFYKRVFDLLYSLGPTVCLSGHTHVWGENTENHRFTVKRFQCEYMKRVTPKGNKLQQVYTINYGVCEIQPKGQHSTNQIIYKKVEEPIDAETVV